MCKRLLGGLAWLTLSVSLTAGAGSGGFLDIRMVKGEKVFLRLEGVRTYALSNPSVVSVSRRGSAFLMEAKAAGVCYINVHAEKGVLRYRAIVDENAFLSRKAEEAQKAISSPHIVVYGKGGRLFLEGEAASSEEVERARKIATTFWPEVGVNLAVQSKNPPLNLNPQASSPINSSRQGAGPLMPSDADQRRRLTLILGTGKVITTKGLLKRVAVADEKICQPVIVNAHQVFLIAKQVGVTSLYIWEEPLIVGGEGRVWEYEVEVREKGRNLKAELEETLREAGFSNVKVRFVGEKKVVLLGRVPTEEDKRKAEAIATAFAENVVNLIEVERPPPPPPPKVPPEQEKARRIKEAIGLAGVNVKVVGNTAILTGEVETEEQKKRAEEIAGLFGLKVVNQLTSRRPKREKQVQVEARVMELDWRWLRNLGLDWGTTDLFGYTRWFKYYRPGVGVPTGIGFPGVGVGVPGVGMGLTTGALSIGELWAGGGFARLSPIFALVRFLEQRNIGRVLSAPNLTLKSGETGMINVGGEIPLPSPTVGAVGAVAVGVTYKTYGITLEVTPQVKEPNLIDLTVRAQVSELDWENAITIMGTTVPAMRTREAQTVLQVRDGETIVIGGLISEEDRKSIHKVPVLGDLPVIGGIFRRKEERKSQTVLVFFLTAHILE